MVQGGFLVVCALCAILSAAVYSLEIFKWKGAPNAEPNAHIKSTNVTKLKMKHATRHTASTSKKSNSHNETIDILPLLPWEREAIDELKRGESTICHVPDEIHNTCCPGSFSRGGQVKHIFADQCYQADFEKAERLAREFCERWPISPSENSCDVCQIIELLRKIKQPLTMMGDSMTYQAFDGFICELHRRNYEILERNEKRIDRPAENVGRGNIKRHITIRVHSPLWQPDEELHIQFLLIYSVPFLFPEEEESFNNVGGVLWFNFGLHDHSLKQNMEIFFLSLRENAKFSLLLFRETSAQHFDIPGGMYTSEKPYRSTKCTPLEWNSMVGDRDRQVKNAAMRSGYTVVPPHKAKAFSAKSRLVVLPFHNFTAQLHGNHPFDVKTSVGECTHYCSTPMIWVPLWRTFRLAMDAAFG